MPGAIGRMGFYAEACAPSVEWEKPGVFFGFRGDRPEIFGTHGLSGRKIRENFGESGACVDPWEGIICDLADRTVRGWGKRKGLDHFVDANKII